MRSEGKSFGEFCQILNMLKSAIQKTYEKYRATGSVINKSRSGRPRKTSEM